MPDFAPTPRLALNTVLHRLVAGVQEVLGASLVGAWLQGSFAVGDADLHSDVDFVVVSAAALDESQVAALQDLHGRIHDDDSPLPVHPDETPRQWNRFLEGSYAPLATWRNPDRRGEPLWYLDNGSRSLIRSTHCNTLVVRQVVREHGVPLLPAPSAQELFPPVPVGRLQSEMLATAIRWRDELLEDPASYANRFYQGLLVLSYCRIWRDLLRGDCGSKRAGAAWAAQQLDDATWRGLIERAWWTRPEPAVSGRTPADPTDFSLTVRFVELVTARCREFAAGAGIRPDPAPLR